MYLKLAFFLLRTVDCGFGDEDADADVEFGWRGNEKLVVDIPNYILCKKSRAAEGYRRCEILHTVVRL